MTILSLRAPVSAAPHRSGSPARWSRLLLAATFALPLAAQNWVGFGDEAWPAGNNLFDRAGILPNQAGLAMVRLDGWEHGGWGSDFALNRTIWGVKFYVKNTSLAAQSLPIRLLPESTVPLKDHEPDLTFVGGNLGVATIPASFTGLFVFSPGGAVTVPCQKNGDFFISFGLTAGDGLSLGYINSAGPTADTPSGGYVLHNLGYPPLVKPSHRLNVILGAVTYWPIASQFYIDVEQSANLVSGVGGTITSQTTYLGSGVGQGTTDFLSGSNPWCGTGAPPGTRALVPADSVTMTARSVPLANSPVFFVVCGGPILPCSAELWHPPGITTGTICVDPAALIFSSVAFLSASGDATVTYGPIPPFACGWGISHQAFVIDVINAEIHAGPCDHQDLW